MTMQWTFTTSNPDEALAVSQLILYHRLHSFTETRSDATTVAPRKTPAKRKTVAPDLGIWADKDARKIKTKVNTWANARLRQAQRVGRGDVYEYANALGISTDQANAKIRAHYDHLAEFERQQLARGRAA
jgi:hypothetical protein